MTLKAIAVLIFINFVLYIIAKKLDIYEDIFMKNKYYILLSHIVATFLFVFVFVQKKSFFAFMFQDKIIILTCLFGMFLIINSCLDALKSIMLEVSSVAIWLIINLLNILTSDSNILLNISNCYIIVYTCLTLSLIIKAYKIYKNQYSIFNKKHGGKSFFHKYRFVIIITYYFALVFFTIYLFSATYNFINIRAVRESDGNEGIYNKYTEELLIIKNKSQLYKNEIDTMKEFKKNNHNKIINCEIDELEKQLLLINIDLSKKIHENIADAGDCFYFSTITYTTIGYGDILAIGKNTRRFVVIETLIAHIFSVLIIPLLLSLSQNNDEWNNYVNSNFNIH